MYEVYDHDVFITARETQEEAIADALIMLCGDRSRKIVGVWKDNKCLSVALHEGDDIKAYDLVKRRSNHGG